MGTCIHVTQHRRFMAPYLNLKGNLDCDALTISSPIEDAAEGATRWVVRKRKIQRHPKLRWNVSRRFVSVRPHHAAVGLLPALSAGLVRGGLGSQRAVNLMDIKSEVADLILFKKREGFILLPFVLVLEVSSTYPN